MNENEIKSETPKKGSSVGKIIFFLIVFLAAAVYGILKFTVEQTAMIRDIAIVVYVLETLVVLIALAVLVSQVSKLVSLTKTEVKPILKTTNETVNSVKGTVTFLGNNMVEPTIKANAAVSGVSRAFGTILDIFKR